MNSNKNELEQLDRRKMLAMGVTAGVGMAAMAVGPNRAEASATASADLTGLVSVKDFGAVGNGIADDTAAIQNAINQSQTVSTSEGAVIFPTGKYKISDTLKVENLNSVSLIGMRASIVQTNPNKDIIQIKNSTACSIKGLHFSAGSNHNAHGIVLDYARRVSLENVSVYQVGKNCLWATKSWWLFAQYCSFQRPGVGEYCVKHFDTEMNNVVYLHTRFAGSSSYQAGGIYHEHGSALSLISCDFSWNNIAAYIYGGSNVDFSGCYFEDNATGIKWGSLNSWPQCCEVRNCFLTSGSRRNAVLIHIERGTHFKMSSLKLVGDSVTTIGIKVSQPPTWGANKRVVIDQSPYTEGLATKVLDPGNVLKIMMVQDFV